MYLFKLLILTAFISLISQSDASNGIPSFGLQTSPSFRNNITDQEFVLDYKRGLISKTPDFIVQNAELSTFPVLAAPDVQFFTSTVVLKPGKSLTPHYHPRASELVIAIKGDLKVNILLEGIESRMMNVNVKQGSATVIPQGHIQRTKCISESACRFIDVMSSADPGFVAVKL